jgi:hypothetical protein
VRVRSGAPKILAADWEKRGLISIEALTRARAPPLHAGGMERPTDTYKRTHGLVLKPRDTTFGGQVSRLQVRPGGAVPAGLSLSLQ